MITIVATLRAKEQYREAVLEALQELVNASLQEEGCREYRLHTSIANPLEFLFYESWESKEAIDKHTQTTHFLNFQQKAAEWLDKSEINLYKPI
ncbi:putative quinol monooxygenase [Flavobacterium cerinum]|uniref:Antibiotic biosynthesis monooxygenase n=1 Tax=Flavobacterium cerinum TaxID=2502784 RepID=A0ABY5IWD4_9FLAO|nr:putative quinol monooxygenase [Flavobacterium cerinum]UUC47153.1 antibiotic biosynthesis monooxygenase [Flavobacterium cerinum]